MTKNENQTAGQTATFVKKEKLYRVEARIETGIKVYAESPEEALKKANNMTLLQCLRNMDGISGMSIVGCDTIFVDELK